LARREVAREGEAGGLHGVRPDTHEEEGEHAADPSRPERAGVTPLQQQQRERHDRQAAELEQRALPEVRHAPPPEGRAMQVAAVADQRAERRDEHRQREHRGDPGGRRPSSTIITRLSVPASRVMDMPTVSWKRPRRSRRPSGSVSEAASANGTQAAPFLHQPRGRGGGQASHRTNSTASEV
jgi:hypothetical protein